MWVGVVLDLCGLAGDSIQRNFDDGISNLNLGNKVIIVEDLNLLNCDK
jgi:hypothetical protein